MHSECSRQRVRKDPPVMNQPQWEAWPSVSPELPDCLTQDNDGTLPSSAEECVKQIPLPKQLEAVRKAAEFPTERHRWNTNEEVAAILIAFDRHESWEKQEVKTRPPSGTMLLYSRKKVRYRKDGYCWKKRKDGKTTREDHMKLKVQGIECIYGSYVHSAILPTFHRRCYWLLQNPDLVLVHYLNVPLTDDNKICLPPVLQIDSKEWSEEELVSQLRPMFASVKHFDMPDSINEKTEGSVDSLVKHILSSPSNSSASTPVCIADARKSHAVVEALQQNSAPETKVVQTSNPSAMHGRVLQLIYGPQVVPADGTATAVPCVINQQQGTRGTALGLTVCEPRGATTGAVLQGLKPNAALGSGHKLVPHNGPLILNVAPMPGSKGLLILSSQQAVGTKGSTLSVLHPAVSAARLDLSSNKKTATNRTSSYVSVSKEAFRPPYSSGAAPENTRAQSEPAIVAGKSPCYDISDFLNHEDILGDFSLQSVVKTETVKSSVCQTSGDVLEFSEVTCAPEFSTAECVSEPGSTAETDAQDLNHIGLESMEFLFGDSGLTDQEQRSLISENDIKCEFYDFHESPLGGRSRDMVAVAAETVESTSTPCLPDNMDTTLAGNQKDMDDIKALHGHDIMMDEFEDILDIVSESLGSSVDLGGTFSLSDGPGPASSKLYHSGDVSVSGLSMSAGDKSHLDCLQSETRSMNDDRLYCGEQRKSGLVEITDYCPEWSYTEGGTKVLVTGPWHQTASSYSILFDNVSVPTSMVQGGVLRCFAPAHCPAVVCLRVAYNDQVISEPKVFEYKSRDQTEAGSEIDWFLVQDRQVKDSLVQRFLDVKKSLPEDQTTVPLTSLQSEVTESDLVALVDRLAEQPLYPHCVAPKQSSARLTLLHLSAALGFSRLVSALIKWRINSPSLVSEQEVNSTSVDIKGNTPLMWACARGHYNVIAILTHWNPDSVHVPNKANWRPAALLNHFGHHEIVELFQQIGSTSEMTVLEELGAGQQQQWQSSQDFESCGEIVKFCEPSCELIFSPLCPGSLPPVSEAKTKFRTFRKSGKDGRGESPAPSTQSASRAGENGADACSSVLTKCSSTRRRLRLMKRTSVDILPDFPQFHSELTKLSRTGAHPCGEDGGGDAAEARCHMMATTEHVSCTIRLRTSSSDPHLTNLVQLSHPATGSGGGDPMISRIDRDLNSPVLFLESSFSEDKGLSLEDLQRETVAMEMDSRNELDGLSHDDGSEMLQSSSVETDDTLTHSNQMMNLASQIIAAMPDRIKLSPNHSKHLLMDEINSRRDRTSSYGSFSSCSSSTPPICIAEDSGISTPLEGMSFLEYRYSDIGTPTSILSPSSTCIQSPYSFGLDSPPPTAAEFTEYFNAPAMYMEKDFSQLTLSDEEQQRLYEAAKIIQSFYRKYKDKKEQQLRQQQKEIEAAILIQSYYRRYKQFMYYKRMTQAAVLIQSQFRSYYAQKRFRRSREAATIIQNRYRAYKEHERYKKSRNAAVIIQQRFRSHYQRTLAGRQSTLASTVQKMMADSDVSLGPTGAQEWDIEDTEQSQSSSESGEPRPKTKSEGVGEVVAAVDGDVSVSEDICCKEELSETEDNESARV